MRENVRLKELQERYRALETKIEDSEIKRAVSIIYGMVQELWKESGANTSGQAARDISISEIMNMYRNAPKMEAPAVNKPLPEGTAAPDFSLKDANNNIVLLSDFRGSTVLLVFYPLDWSPGCSQQLDLYENEFPEFEKRDVKVIAISVDSIYSHGAWAAVRKIHFPLLSDFNPKGEVSRKYNVYREDDGFSERALYIIDGEGTIRYGYVSPYVHHIPDIYQLFKVLDEIHNPV